MADLTKFGVTMPGGVRNGILHPKQNYRFRILFKGFGVGQFTRELTQNVMECKRPNYSEDIVELNAYNSRAYIRGKHKWDEITVKFRDDITNSVSSAVGSQIQKQMNHFEQTSSVAGINYKFDMEIHALDGTNGEELESWELNGCFISGADYSGGNYENGEVQTIEITVRYDNATQLRGPGGDGITVGTDPFPNNPSLSGGTRA
jgi:hypothetical protein